MKHIIKNVPYIYQRELYVNGCESVSSVMVLRYFGFDITVEQFIADYLDIGRSPNFEQNGVRYGADPYLQYPGNPCDNTGWGCFPPVIMKALARIPDISRFCLKMHSGASIASLCEQYIARDIPVIFWASIDMKPTHPDTTWLLEDGSSYTWRSPMHCLVLTGYDDDGYYFNDPWQRAECFYPTADVERAYREMGSYAVTVEPRD